MYSSPEAGRFRRLGRSVAGDPGAARTVCDNSDAQRRARWAHRTWGMSKLLRGVAAGWGATKLGGGCLSTLIVFGILWWALGHFGIFR